MEDVGEKGEAPVILTRSGLVKRSKLLMELEKKELMRLSFGRRCVLCPRLLRLD